MEQVLYAFEWLRQFMPDGAVAAIILLTGWLLAVVSRLAAARLLDVAPFRRVCDRTGVTAFLRKGEVPYSPAQCAGVLLYWLILLAALFQVGALFQVQVLQTFSQRMAEHLPACMGVLLILVIGMLVVTFIANFVRTIANNAAFPYAHALAAVIRWVGIVFVVAVAIEQLGVGLTVARSVFQIILAALVFGVALAFGLGCKDMARDAMVRFLAKLREHDRSKQAADMEG